MDDLKSQAPYDPREGPATLSPKWSNPVAGLAHAEDRRDGMTHAELYAEHQEREKARLDGLKAADIAPGTPVRYVGPHAFPAYDGNAYRHPKPFLGELVKIENGIAHVKLPPVRNAVGQEIVRTRKLPVEHVEEVS